MQNYIDNVKMKYLNVNSRICENKTAHIAMNKTQD